MDEEKIITELKPKPRLVAVQVVRVTGGSALVEFARKGKAQRVTVPAAELQAGKVAQDVLDAGIPYGLPWEETELASITAADLAANLRTAGIWTTEDLQRNTQKAVGVLQATYQLDLAALLRFAKEYGGK